MLIWDVASKRWNAKKKKKQNQNKTQYKNIDNKDEHVNNIFGQTNCNFLYGVNYIALTKHLMRDFAKPEDV